MHRANGDFSVVESIAPAPGVIQAPTPVVEYLAPVPAVCHAPVFCLSSDASDLSSPEDECTSSCIVASAHQILYTGRKCGALEPGKRDADRVSWSRTSGGQPTQGGVCSRWLREEAARRGYAWRQQRRARQISSSREACVCPRRRFGNWQREGRVRVRVSRVLERVLGLGWL